MSTGPTVFDRTLQQTNIWLGEIGNNLEVNRHVAWHVLCAVLRTLRDRLPLELSVHFSAELPLLVRGAFFDQWRPAVQDLKVRSLTAFLERIDDELYGTMPVDPEDAAVAVFETINAHMDPGQVEKVRHALPAPIREIWPSPRHRSVAMATQIGP